VDAAAAEEWGRLNVPDPLPVIDGLLAASAKIRGWTLVTRNAADVARSGVALLNPFEPAAR
jgi:predicted nucleic acid-binding protein